MIALFTSSLLLSLDPEPAANFAPAPQSMATSEAVVGPQPAPAPEEPKKRKSDGRGMLIASGVLGGVALGMSAGHAAMFHRLCDSFHYDDGCYGDGTPQVLAFLFSAPTLALTGTGLGLALTGARRRGRASSGASVRSRRRDVVVGATLLGTGIAMRLLSIGFIVPALTVDSDAVYDGEIDGERIRRLHTSGIVIGQVGDTLAATGGGLVVYGGQSGAEFSISPGGFQIRF